MILVMILVVAWLVILGPSLLRRRSGHGDGVSSISHFHRQLSVLEHSGSAPIVLPAYRLHSVDGEPANAGPRYPDVASVPVLTVVGADQHPRPALAFLGDAPPAPVVEATAPSARRADPVASYRSPDPELRSLARRRRRDTLMTLLMVTVLTLMIGFIPGAGVAWVVSAITGLALVAYVAMLVHLRSMADERERKLRYLQPTGAADARFGHGGRHGEYVGSEAGDDAYGDVLGEGVSTGTGDYSHPARQAVAR